MKKRKIKPNQQLTESHIKPNEHFLNSLLKFSFKYLHSTSQFNYQQSDSAYFLALLQRLKELSKLKLKELSSKSKTLKFHAIAWEKTTESGFMGIEKELWDGSSFQFSLSRNKLGRVHGFFVLNVFYIVWLDVEHNLYM